MAGSSVLPAVSAPAAEALRGALKVRINAAWSTEAVRQGVGYAKVGNYEEAHRCYAKAIELQHDNADAYVARGAAYANSRQYSEAAASFRHALRIDPNSRNAGQYLDAVLQRAAQEGIAIREVASPAVDAGQAEEAGAGAGPSQPHGKHPRSETPAAVAQQDKAGQAGQQGGPDTGPIAHHQERTAAGASSSSNSSSSDSGSSSSSGSSLDGLDAQDIKRALAEVLRARSASKKSSRKSSKKKRKKSKDGKRSKSKKSKHKSSKKRRRYTD